MKKLTCLGLSLALALGLFTGCGSSNNQDQGSASGSQSNTNDSSTVELSGTVNTAGSTSMKDVMAVLTEVFEKENPGVTINYTGSGSGAGIEGATSGTCDIGLSSRAIKDEEKSAGAVENIVALDGVAIVVNPANGVEDLTVEQIAQIFTGEITNWSEVGGADGEIAVFGREAGSGTRGAFEEIVGVEDACKYTNEYSSTGDVIGNVASNPNAIGYASLSAVDDTVKAVKVNGVAPSEDTVKDGTYEIQRPFVMVTKEGAELSEAAQAFLEFAMSADVADYIAAAGAVSPKG
ncbi:phosphate ABC transporter substrate-binding protein [Pseudoflavonifractor phocaeensis]|uniref:phosphate ABC transporter substrate-binding protein n=1 Tax=Pseudoflavonifractor phocaeensis TaxID=1870988 RepID=UPI0025A3762F|nr:phosphate ABC transporter substrate-binding protein [Pseudoflavonifractor phocaeensis]MDM8238076.1 phosphate ABC transporter substrate-binding protein [Pseudoflavonifractor phocaeensis]